MDVENAKILSIGEIKQTKSGHKIMNVVMKTPTEANKTFVIFENREPAFDLIRQFERGVYKVGDTVAFNFNKADESWKYDNIWKLKIRNERRRETKDSTATSSATATRATNYRRENS